MVETVGETYERNLTKQKETPQQTAWMKKQQQQSSPGFDVIFNHMTSLKCTVSNRVRFMILNLEELRQSNWKPRGGDKGPKTVEEVRSQAEQERIQNVEERMEVKLNLFW